MDRLLIATLLTASLAAAMPAAVAQTAPSETKARQARHFDRDVHARRPFRLPSERVEARLAYLHTALKITEAQKTQWENFAAVMRRHARESDQRIQERRAKVADRSARQPLNAIERLERRQKSMEVRAQRLNELVAAGKPLYAAFTPEQKQAADEMLTSRRGHGGPDRQRGMRG
jgi:hypothetical protein